MKFCIVTQQLGKIITGPGLYANNLVNSLVNDGHQVSVLAPGNQRPPGKLPYEFISIKTPQFSQSQARWLPLAFEFGNTLKNLQNKHSFSLLHFTDAREYLFTPRSIPAVGNINDTYSAD
ncbi:MAG: hypothetical protein HY835_07840, partial [Anaerolineae bacterium]|nr:hypothetical protein [Anaerolineae bacterium]